MSYSSRTFRMSIVRSTSVDREHDKPGMNTFSFELQGDMIDVVVVGL